MNDSDIGKLATKINDLLRKRATTQARGAKDCTVSPHDSFMPPVPFCWVFLSICRDQQRSGAAISVIHRHDSFWGALLSMATRLLRRAEQRRQQSRQKGLPICCKSYKARERGWMLTSFCLGVSLKEDKEKISAQSSSQLPEELLDPPRYSLRPLTKMTTVRPHLFF